MNFVDKDGTTEVYIPVHPWCPIGPGQVQKAQKAMSNCLFALGPYISPMTNVLLTDLGLSIPLSFIDKCVSTQLFIKSTLLKHPIFHPYLIYFHRQIQGIKSSRNVK